VIIILAAMLLLLTFSTDFIEYGHYKTGMRREGITIAFETFTTKLMSAGAAALGGVALSLIRFDATLPEQSPETLKWLWIVACAAPVIGTVLGLPFLMKCDFTSGDMQIMADINGGRISWVLTALGEGQ